MQQHLKPQVFQESFDTKEIKLEIPKGIVERAIAEKSRRKKEQGRYLVNRKKAAAQ